MVLIVKVISVAGVKEEDTIGKNDLYVKLSTDGKTWQQTQVMRNAGKSAVFQNEVFQFDVLANSSAKLHVEVYDKDPVKDDLLGKDTVALNNVAASEEDVVVTLKKHVIHRHAGNVNLRVSYV
ncbi:hypothetical protein HKX48_005603 [Thoreauomyces humboldtii]|nr:hypothetical protein HKX48_005603 [Thoreauomyces humboldtii]